MEQNSTLVIAATGVALVYFAWQLRCEHVANAELLSEARLLALELNKKGDPTAIVHDPLLPTLTAERAASNTARAASNIARARWYRLRLAVKTGEIVRPTSVRRLLSGELGKLKTKVIGVCGMSCSGKSTVSSVLRSHAESHGMHVPVLCLDDSYHEWMFDAPSHDQPTNVVPEGSGGRAWKNWEEPRCVDWPLFLSKLRAKIAIHSGSTPYIVVEGFLLLEHAAAAGLLDHVVSIEVGKECAWQRRLKRALQMAAGSQDASGMENYEQIHFYATEDDYASVHADGAAAVARLGEAVVYPRAGAEGAKTDADLSHAAGAYDWLRLYFDEVIWPEAAKVRRHVDEARASGRIKVHVVDGEVPPADVERATRQIISDVFVV